jgi:hypothetical protein
MARPSPTIICEHVERDKTIQVAVADAVYAVLYQGLPIKLRKFNADVKYMGFKYSKTSFPEPGHALRLARELNQAHNTKDFSVGIMSVARIIPV